MVSVRLRHWIAVLRLWSLTAAAVPVVLGAALAACSGCFAWRMLGVTLVAGIALQLAANLLNTYGDFCAGVDRPEYPPNAPQLVYGWLRPVEVLTAGLVALLLGAVSGVLAAALSDWHLLWFALAGILGAASYTTLWRFKYLGLGVPLVAVLMGFLMVMASFYAQTRGVSGQSIMVSLPVACLVAAILLGNDLRDVTADADAGIRTAALLLGPRLASRLFAALHAVAYLSTVLFVMSGLLPRYSLLTLLVLPLSLRLNRAAFKGVNTELEGGSAAAHLLFGILLSASLLLSC